MIIRKILVAAALLAASPAAASLQDPAATVLPQYGEPCFQTGDGEYRFYQAAKCTRDTTGGFGPYKCTFANGDAETECFTNGICFVCSGMD